MVISDENRKKMRLNKLQRQLDEMQRQSKMKYQDKSAEETALQLKIWELKDELGYGRLQTVPDQPDQQQQQQQQPRASTPPSWNRSPSQAFSSPSSPLRSPPAKQMRQMSQQQQSPSPGPSFSSPIRNLEDCLEDSRILLASLSSPHRQPPSNPSSWHGSPGRVGDSWAADLGPQLEFWRGEIDERVKRLLDAPDRYWVFTGDVKPGSSKSGGKTLSRGTLEGQITLRQHGNEVRNFTRNVVHDGWSNFRCCCCLLALFKCWGTTGGPDGDTVAFFKQQGETINWIRARHVPGCVPLNGQDNEERETLAPKLEGNLDNITRLFSDLGWSGFGRAREYHVYGIWNTHLGCYLWVGQTNQLHARYAQHRNNEKRPFFKNPDNKMIVMAMNMLAAHALQLETALHGLFNSVQRQKGLRETESQSSVEFSMDNQSEETKCRFLRLYQEVTRHGTKFEYVSQHERNNQLMANFYPV